MSVLDQFGITADQAKAAAAVKYPSAVPGRVAHIDADFMSYQVSAESKAELDPEDSTPRKTIQEMRENAVNALEHIMRMARAEKAVCHVTPTGSTKGGRDAAAMLQPYQANRSDRNNRPEHLDVIREYISKIETDVLTGVAHMDQEADDGMARAAYDDPENAIICSMDKDLWMVPGWYFDWDKSKPVHYPDTFGYLEIKEMVSPTTGKVYKKKLVGRGTKYLWAQLLMGDSADNISGLPACPGVIWQEYAGTKAYVDMMKQYVAAKDTEQAEKLSAKVDALTAKTKPCGDMLAYALLKDVVGDVSAFNLVKACYTLLAKNHGYEFKNYRNDKPLSPTQALLSEMQLLWMRRNSDPMDCLAWLKEVTNAKPRYK